MSNKKRIAKKIESLKRITFRKNLNAHIFSFRNSANAANHMADAFRYLTQATNLLNRDVKVYPDYQSGIDFASQFSQGKFVTIRISPMIPEKYLEDFKGLIDAGFTEIDAFETLKETYNF